MSDSHPNLVCVSETMDHGGDHGGCICIAEQGDGMMAIACACVFLCAVLRAASSSSEAEDLKFS